MNKFPAIAAFVVCVFLVKPTSVQAQRLTIPDQIARGGVGGVATTPSGPTPTISDLVRTSDLIVIGTVGEGRSYVSADQYDVYTDFPVADASILYPPEMARTQTPGKTPAIAVTQLGGTVVLDGHQYAAKHAALAPLRPGSKCLFLLQRVGDKYVIGKLYYGAFDVTTGRVTPLAEREDFAPDVRNAPVADFVQRVEALIREKAAKKH